MSNQIQQLALKCLSASKNQRDDAVDMLESMLQQKPSLLKSVLRDVARDAILYAQAQQREQLGRNAIALASAKASKIGDARGAFSYSQALASGFLDSYALPNGVLLGDATAEDLKHGINYLRASAKTHEQNAAFLEAVLKRTKAGKRVRDCLAEADVKQLKAA